MLRMRCTRPARLSKKASSLAAVWPCSAACKRLTRSSWKADANAPMRAVNDKLGYEPRPAWIRLEAPLDEVEATLAADAGLRRRG